MVPPSSPADRTGDPLTGLSALIGTLAEVLTPASFEGRDSARLRDAIRQLRRLEGLAATAMAAAVKALADQGGTAEDGAPSTTAWLRARTGRSARDAAQTARLASSLDELPATAAALAAGEMTAESADAVVRAARDGRIGSPAEVEAQLLDVARTQGPERVRAEVRRRTQEADGAAMLRDEQRQHARRRLSLTRREDGMWDLYGLLPAETGERARTLLDIHDTPDPKDTPPGARRRPEQRLADALDSAVGVALALGDNPTMGGVARPHVSVIVDVTTFDADLTDPLHPDRPVAADAQVWAGLPAMDTSWSGPLSPQPALRLCCDATVSRIVMAGESQVLDVGRATREWSPGQRRAINARDRCCRGPGCGRPIGWTEIHHLDWWRHGGRTDVDNGLALCAACHRLVHEGGWSAELDVATAAVTWTSPDRRQTIVTHPRPAA